MQHIPLKQYMDSKRQLIEAIKLTPTTLIEYEIRKYCTLSVGSDADDSQTIALKPKQVLTVEWVYHNPSNPTPAKITLSDKDTLIEQDMHWSNEKLTKWLMRHAKEGKNLGHTP